MRFALIATSAAAAVAAPFVVAAAGPQMTSSEFVTAVRCTAYEQVTSPQNDLGAAKVRLNAEARRQAPETAQEARSQVTVIAAEAAGVDNASKAAILRERASSCADQGQVASTARMGGAA